MTYSVSSEDRNSMIFHSVLVFPVYSWRLVRQQELWCFVAEEKSTFKIQLFYKGLVGIQFSFPVSLTVSRRSAQSSGLQSWESL